VLTSDVLELARQQHGVLSVAQLHERLGVSADAVGRARRAGRVIDVLPGVVRVASSPDTFIARCAAATLCAGDVGCVSGWSAAHFYGLRAMPTGTIHFTVPHRIKRPTAPWIHLHRCSWFDGERDRDVIDQLTLATPMRMLFGLAAAFNQFRFERAAEDAWHRGLLTPASAADYLARHRCRGKDGVATFERWLEHALEQRAPSQSVLERKLLAAIDRVGLPRPDRQHPLVLANGETIHLDIAWPDVRFAVEPGASWWHGGDLGQRRDQARDRACSEIGWHVVRFDEQLRSDPTGAAQQILRIHRRRQLDLRNLSESVR
jgi:very-short-patch-repair endonuclease